MRLATGVRLVLRRPPPASCARIHPHCDSFLRLRAAQAHLRAVWLAPGARVTAQVGLQRVRTSAAALLVAWRVRSSVRA